jgi:hypothetical protein
MLTRVQELAGQTRAGLQNVLAVIDHQQQVFGAHPVRLLTGSMLG